MVKPAQREIKPVFDGLTLFLSLLTATCLSGQEAAYFQQTVDYRIDARLDDQRHELSARLELDYQNNAPVALDTIVFHLYPRAFRSDASAFAAQQRLSGNARFHFRPPDENGDLDSLDFTVDGQTATHQIDALHPDLAYLVLPQPLAPGKQVTISTPFRVKIPASFSRLGRVGESYQLTQWYPKPAVYDRDGWHPQPYLDRGEFYGEFGSFTVNITLPDNYTVAATGTLNDASERSRLLEIARVTQQQLAQRNDLSSAYVEEEFPASSATTKTLSYRAERVHDFAWFADKRFKILHDTVVLNGGKPIDVWSFFTETEARLWKASIDYLSRALRFFSQTIGPYPYPQVTGVQSALSAGAGMEYPMITVIGQSGSAMALDEVLAHEVAHNWFYGILGSNERDHPWMDEGLTSYYEERYINRFYPGSSNAFSFLGDTINLDELGYRYAARQGNYPAPERGSEGMESTEYWIGAYSLSRLALRQLELVYGAPAVDEALSAYFAEWAFRHPSPGDLRRSMENSLAADLGWWFKGLLEGKGFFDPRPSVSKAGTRIINKGGLDLPIIVSHADSTYVITDYPTTLPPGARVSDFGPLDLYPNNGKKTTFAPGLYVGAERSDAHRVFIGLLPGFNVHDGFQLQPIFHNRTLAPRRLEYLIAPNFGFASGQVGGYAGIRWRLADRPDGQSSSLRSPVLSLDAKRYGHRSFEGNVYPYLRVSGRFSVNLHHPAPSGRQSQLSLRAVHLDAQRPRFVDGGQLSGTETDNSFFLRASYQRSRKDAINPRGSQYLLEYGLPGQRNTASFLRLSAEWTGGYQYGLGQWIRWRAFGAYFILNDLRGRNLIPDYALRLIPNATADYDYSGLFAGRNTNQAIYDQQLGAGGGDFRAPISSAFSFGGSNDFLAAFNLDAQLPFVPAGFPVGTYLDAGVYGPTPISQATDEGFHWVGGLSLSTLNDRIGLYLPLVGSPEVRDRLAERGGLFNRLVLRVKFSQLWPWKLMDEFSL